MRIIGICLLIFAIASCSNKKTLTSNLEGSWYLYKYLNHSVDETTAFQDSFPNYTLTFTNGSFVEQWKHFTVDTPNYVPDTLFNKGTWSFVNNNDKLEFKDPLYTLRDFTIFNLEGDHVELRLNGDARYLRKK